MHRRPTCSILIRPLTKALFLACSVTLVAACSDSGGSSTTGPDPTLVVVTVQVTPAVDTLNALGLTGQFAATAANASGGSISGKTFTWTTSDTTVATVSAAGLATAVDNGTVAITATVDGIAGTATLLVAQEAATVTLTPASDTLVSLGDTTRLVADVVDAQNQPLATPNVAWMSADTLVATVDSTGLVTSTGNGAASIIATSGSVADTAAVTVAQVPISISVTPANDTLVALTDTLRLVLAVTDALNQTIASPSVTWASADEAVVTVDATGLVTSVANGSTTVTATAGAVSATATVTVSQVPAAVVVTPTASTFASLGDTVRIAASVLDAKSVAIATATVTWGSSSAAVATVGTTGLVTAVANGTTSVSATFGALADTAAITVAQVPTTISVSAGGSQSVVVNTAAVVAPAVRVDDARANPVPGVVVTFAVVTGNGTITGAVAATDATGIASVGSWTVGAAADTNTVTATATGTGITGNPVTFTAIGVNSLFDIKIRYSTGTAPSPTQQRAFTDAANFWRAAITGDLANVTVNTTAGTFCGATTPALTNEPIDDLLIYVEFLNIDNVGGILGSAGPCVFRITGGLPAMGGMKFDLADLGALEASNDLEGVIRHEMAHVLGFGTLWNNFGFLEAPSDTDGNPVGIVGADTHFDGPEARTSFDELLGSTAYAGDRVPVENDNANYLTGSLDSHWRESVFGTELMTPGLNTGVRNLVSEVTISSLEDMGYIVNVGAAEAYVLPPSPPAAFRQQGTIRVLNDVWVAPFIYMIGDDGTSVRVFRR